MATVVSSTGTAPAMVSRPQAQAREGSFWWTGDPMATPISACGGKESRPGSITASDSDGLFPVYHSLLDCESGSNNRRVCGQAQPMRHGLASKRRRPEMKTFLDLDAISTRSRNPSLLFSEASIPRSSQPQLNESDATLLLFSDGTSAATIRTTTDLADATSLVATTMSTDSGAIRAIGADATNLHHSALRELRDLELMQDTDLARPDRSRQRGRANDHHLRVFDNFSDDDRPSSSRSHLRYWHRNKSPVPDASRYLRVSSEGSSPSISNLPSMTMTRDEFNALPSTIQRKYFSTLERMHIAQNPASFPDLTSTSKVCQDTTPLGGDNSNYHRPTVLSSLSDPTNNRRGHLRINTTERQFYASLPDKIKRRHLSEEEQLVAQSRPHRRRSLSVGAADDFLKPRKRRTIRSSAAQSSHPRSAMTTFDRSQNLQLQPAQQGSTKTMADGAGQTFFNSFRWLEEEDDLDLRLFLDDYHINLRDEVPLPGKSRRPSFRRHLSISKLPFGRTNFSTTRLSTSTRPPVFTPITTKPPSLMGDGPVQAGRRSRALSLVTGNKQPMPVSPTTAAAHYQDPEARLRLREYIGSSTKFDEALEFGFPSMEERPVQRSKAHFDLALDFDKPRTFFDDDDKSSCTDEASVAEPETPRTPRAFDKPTSEHLTALTAFPIMETKTDYLQPPLSSREMTLRMTLTRPDLRTNEEQMYGWQKDVQGGPAHIRSGSKAPAVLVRDISPKESIERQFAAFDQEDLAAHENGVVRRFWKKVRRS